MRRTSSSLRTALLSTSLRSLSDDSFSSSQSSLLSAFSSEARSFLACSSSPRRPLPSEAAFFARGSFSLTSFCRWSMRALARSASVPRFDASALAVASWPMKPEEVESSEEDMPVRRDWRRSSEALSAAVDVS